MSIERLHGFVDLLTITYLIDWSRQEPITPQPGLLKKVKAVRSRQSETSRKRQAFISGMNAYRFLGDEAVNRSIYIEEWSVRATDNV